MMFLEEPLLAVLEEKLGNVKPRHETRDEGLHLFICRLRFHYSSSQCLSSIYHTYLTATTQPDQTRNITKSVAQGAHYEHFTKDLQSVEHGA